VNPVVRFEDEADVEYRDAGRWYDAKSAGLGTEFFDEVDAAVRRILDSPRAGAPVPRVPRDLPIRRLAVKRFPYHVVYMEATDVLWILAIAHDRRKPGFWKHRLK
jgi:toxin ParE1/3/4